MAQPTKLVSIGNYKLSTGSALGKGTFARVELAQHVIMKGDVALKIINALEIKDIYMKTNLRREAKILARLSHPNIIKLVEVCETGTLYVLVLEAVLGGTLFEYVQRTGRLKESQARRMSRQIISALAYLHRERILHRDLKLENILLDRERDRLVLIDFGLSNSWHPGKLMLTHCGSAEYASPELFQKHFSYGPSIDVWSFGIILYSLILGHLPFQIDSKDRGKETALGLLIKKIMKGLCNEHYREMNGLSIDCRVLLMRCLDINPSSRISVDSISSDPWIGYVTPRQPQEIDDSEIAGAIKERLKIKISVPEILDYVRKRKYGTTAGCFNLMKLDYIKKLHQPLQKNTERSLEYKMEQLALNANESSSPDKDGNVKQEEAIDTAEVPAGSPEGCNDSHLKQSNSSNVPQNDVPFSSGQNSDSQAKERRSRSQDSKAPTSWRRSFLNVPSSGKLSFSRLKRTDSQKEGSKQADSGILKMIGLQALGDLTNSVRPLFRNHGKNSRSKFDTLPKSNKKLDSESVEGKNPMPMKPTLKNESITKKLRTRAIKVDKTSHTPRKPIR